MYSGLNPVQLKKKQKELEETVASLETENEKLKTDNKDLQAQVEDLESALDQQEENLEKSPSSTKVEELTEENTVLKAKLRKAAEIVKKLSEEYKKVKNQEQESGETSNDQTDLLNKQLYDVKMQNIQLRRQITELKDQGVYTSQSEQIELLKADRNKYQKLVTKLTEKLVKMRKGGSSAGGISEEKYQKAVQDLRFARGEHRIIVLENKLAKLQKQAVGDSSSVDEETKLLQERIKSLEAQVIDLKSKRRAPPPQRKPPVNLPKKPDKPSKPATPQNVDVQTPPAAKDESSAGEKPEPTVEVKEESSVQEPKPEQTIEQGTVAEPATKEEPKSATKQPEAKKTVAELPKKEEAPVQESGQKEEVSDPFAGLEAFVEQEKVKSAQEKQEIEDLFSFLVDGSADKEESNNQADKPADVFNLDEFLS